MPPKPTAKAKPNIRMVAERARLSPTTVSLVLRGSGSISPETRARVQAAVRELNYTPAPRARRPRADARHLLFTTKDFGDHPVTATPFYGEILNAAEQACADLRVGLTFALLADAPGDAEHMLAAALADHRPDGVLLVGAYAPASIRRVLADSQPPFVLVDNRMPSIVCDSVVADDFGGGWRATEHLIERGHRQIIALVGDLRVASLAARYRGYCAACAEARVAPAPPSETAWERPALRVALERALGHRPRPTAVFCATDALAVFAMELLRDLGLRVPADISVVGFDNLPIARMAHPPLTTVSNHPEQLGRLAVQRLIARLDGDQTPALNITVATHLIVRDSTAHAAGEQ